MTKIELNLPPFPDLKLEKSRDGTVRIFDSLRSKYVVLTPEEWVRQHFVHFLINHRGYPTALMANEVSLKHNGCSRRCDTIIYNHTATPIAIVEYKAPEITISSRTFDQIVRYNMVLGVNFLMVSNGLIHFCCRLQDQNYLFLKDIPFYKEISSSFER